MKLYTEEAKKTEDICLEALHMMENMPKDGTLGPQLAVPPPVPNPLLKGMPGREISAAKTDGAAFAGDVNAPSVLAYPYDLSKQKFEEHPIAKELELTSRQKAEMGLLIPKEVKSRDFYYDFDSEDDKTGKKTPDRKDKGYGLDILKRRRRNKGDEEASPAVSLSPVLERPSTVNIFQKLVNRNRPASDSHQEDTLSSYDCPNDTSSKPGASAAHSSIFSFARRRPDLKKKISEPKLQAKESMTGYQDLPPRSPSALSDVAGPSSRDNAFFDRKGTALQKKTQVGYGIAPPRLSPMEYTRMYFVEKALAKRENRSCELPAPEKSWFWTPRWEKFLLIPRTPAHIKRDAKENIFENSKKGIAQLQQNEAGFGDPDDESGQTVKQSLTESGCPRLSIILGDLTSLMPSLMNLAALDEDSAVNHNTVVEEASSSSIADRELRHWHKSPDLRHPVKKHSNVSVKSSLSSWVFPIDDELATPSVRNPSADMDSTVISPPFHVNSVYHGSEYDQRDSGQTGTVATSPKSDTSNATIRPGKKAQHVDAADALEDIYEKDDSSVYSREGNKTPTYEEKGKWKAEYNESSGLVRRSPRPLLGTPPPNTSRSSWPGPATAAEYSPVATISPFQVTSTSAHFAVTAERLRLMSCESITRLISAGAGAEICNESCCAALAAAKAGTQQQDSGHADASTAGSSSESQKLPLDPVDQDSESQDKQTDGDSDVWPGLTEEIGEEYEVPDESSVYEDEDAFLDMSEDTEFSRLIEEPQSVLHVETSNVGSIVPVEETTRESPSSDPKTPKGHKRSAPITSALASTPSKRAPGASFSSTPTPKRVKFDDLPVPVREDSPTLPSSVASSSVAPSSVADPGQHIADYAPQRPAGGNSLPRTRPRQQIPLDGRARRNVPPPPLKDRKLLAAAQSSTPHTPLPERTAAPSSFSLERARSFGTLTMLPKATDMGYEARPSTGVDATDADHSAQNFSKPLNATNNRLRKMSSSIEPRRLASEPLARLYPHLGKDVEVLDISMRRGNQHARPDTPALGAKSESGNEQTPMGVFSSFFRRQRNNTEPRTKTKKLIEGTPTPVLGTPEVHWRPFDEPVDEPPGTSSWLFGGQEDRLERKLRQDYFKKKVERDEREKQERLQAQNEASKISHVSTSSTSTVTPQKRMRQKQSTDSLSNQKTHHDFSSPRSPAPKPPGVPNLFKMASFSNSTRQASGSTAASAAQPTNEESPLMRGTHKTKKPLNLRVETKKLLRKASAEAESLSGGLRSAFGLDGSRGWGFSRVVEEEKDENGEPIQKSWMDL